MANKALLIIDMQKGSFTPETPRYDTPGVLDRINALAVQCRKEGNPVIFIQHDGTTIGEFIPQTTEWDLLDELDAQPNDLFIDKYANDVFYHSNLGKTLERMGIREIYITGCATDFCVESTIQSALTKDYHITVVRDGHTTGNRPGLDAKQVIDHYNWVWENMLPTNGGISVKETKEIIS